MWSLWKARFVFWAYLKFQNLVHRDWELSEIVFEAVFEALKVFKESGRMDRRSWPGAEGAAAEFELNQCYTWYVQVRPVTWKEIQTIEDFEEYLQYDQRMLERLIKVREWM